MRTKTLSLSYLVTAIALNALGQTGSAGGAGAGAGTSGAGTGSATSGTANQGSAQTVQPRVNQGQIVPQNQRAFQPASGAVNNQFNTQNPLIPNTNQFLPPQAQTNSATGALPTVPTFQQGLGVSNVPGVTGIPGGTVGTANLPMLTQDRVFNGADRSLLVQINRGLRGIFPSPSSLAGVHFQVQQGVVTAVGTVQTLEQKQQVLKLIQGTPNVTQVIDGLRVNAPTGFPVSSTGFGAETNPVGKRLLTPTGVTNQFGVNPNLPANTQQVRTNAIVPANNP